MSDFNTNLTDLNTTVESLREKVAELQIERDEARVRTARAESALTSVQRSLQEDLTEFANSYLQSGDEDYKELSELMVNNGLEGLKRTFEVTVRVTYEFTVEVEATDEDEARDEVDNDITSYAEDNVYLGDTPDEVDIEVTEA